MSVRIWVSDREPAVRELTGELPPEAEIVSPDELQSRLSALIGSGTGARPPQSPLAG
ncbi:MAG: hypothetical protein ABI841_02190 [Chloroflexota bacterium]